VQQWPPRTWTSLAERALHQAQRLQEFAERAPERLVVVRDRAGLAAALAERADGDGPVIGVLGVEGMHALDGDLANLDRLWDAGYRVFGLTHFFDNALGGSLHGTSGAGLTPFGREVVVEIHRRGGIVDLAHASPAMVEEVLEATEGPVIVSHTGLSGVCETPRNLSDDLMTRIADRGGLIGIGYWDAAVCDISPAGVAASIAYGVERLGAGAISLGSDYDGATEVAFDTSELAALTHALLEAELDEEAIRAVMGENTIAFLRRHLP
jgi:microsomal dipeptidase-like Zn-dependent dipeptidase